MEFQEFKKMPRLSRTCVVTEKIDGTNAQIYIADKLQDGDYSKAIYDNGAIVMFAGSRSRWVTPEEDNYGFARWAKENADDLLTLGEGRHFGEWWGTGIQRRYGLEEKRFSLFNVSRWHDPDGVSAGEDITDRIVAPKCCRVVPVLLRGPFRTDAIEECVRLLRTRGSYAAPGYMNPEGVIVFHEAAKMAFKKTLEKDELPKSLAAG